MKFRRPQVHIAREWGTNKTLMTKVVASQSARSNPESCEKAARKENKE